MPRPTQARASFRYAVDQHNRLLVSDPLDVLRPRRVLEGRFRTGAGNRFFYDVNAASDHDDHAPHTVELDGTWSLSDNHELALALHQGRQRQRQRQTLYLKGALVKAQARALVFALRRSEDDDLQSAQRLTLSGRWEADATNRLNFLVEKADGSEDRLTLQSGWGVGPDHELRYRYQQETKRRTTFQHTLSFEGYWAITGADRLAYRIAGSPDSAFEFRASLRSPSLLASEGRIVYEVGVGVSRGRSQRVRVALFGTWKLNRDLSVSFEIPYAEGRVQSLRFEGTATAGPRNRITILLRTPEDDSTGLTVIFTRELVRDASLFLRLQKSAEETSIVGGLQVRF